MEILNFTHSNDSFKLLEIGELVDARKDLTDSKGALNRDIKNIDESIKEIDELLMQYHEENPEVAQVNGSKAKVKWTEEVHYNTEAGHKEAVRDWLFQNGHPYLMTWHLNRASTQQYVDLHGEIPHVTPYVKNKVSCTKL